MTNEEMKDLADEALEIYEQGIRVYANPSDKFVLFAAVIAANTVTYLTICGIKKLLNKKTALRLVTPLKINTTEE